MLHRVARQSFESNLLDDLSKAQIARLHIRRKRLDFLIDDGIEGLKGPPHRHYIAKKRYRDKAPASGL